MLGLRSDSEDASMGAITEIEGYASVFGEEDLNGDVVERGAFLKSLSQRRAGDVKMLFQHDAASPIGLWTDIEERPKGLHVRGRIFGDIPRAHDISKLIRVGAIDGLSIGFRTVKAAKAPSGGARRLTEVELWEVSIVTFPMAPNARISRVSNKTQLGDLAQAQLQTELSQRSAPRTSDGSFSSEEAHLFQQIVQGATDILRQ